MPKIRTASGYERREYIGPYQLEGNRVWLGKQYYDGEGSTGVGAFGYFDMETRQYHLFSPPEISHWEIGAMLVEPDAVWVALDRFVEDISRAPGGLARWDRSDQHISFFPLEFVVETTIDHSRRLRAVWGGGLQRFLVSKTAGGKETARSIAKFPKPPSIY